MSETAIIVVVVVILALSLLTWLIWLSAALILAFTAFVMHLPPIITLLLFILFPPSLLMFLIGYAMGLFLAWREEGKRDIQ